MECDVVRTASFGVISRSPSFISIEAWTKGPIWLRYTHHVRYSRVLLNPAWEPSWLASVANTVPQSGPHPQQPTLVLHSAEGVQRSFTVHEAVRCS